jgi:uncharacterized repeat protein (TIGR03806 family)
MIFYTVHVAALAALLFVALLPVSLRAQPYGLNSRPAIAPFLNNVLPEAAPLVSGSWSCVPAFPNLFFTNAVGLTFVPGTNQLCVWEREGRVWSFQNNSNVAQKKLVLDIHNQCQGWDDSGLLGLAFHPGFATNRFLFCYYTWVIPGTVVGDPNTRPPTYVQGKYHDRLARFTLDADGVAIPGSELVLVDQVGDNVWHNGGGMFFHPTNGFLYYTDGDDADTANTQKITNNLFSGVFRIDVDQRGGGISHPIVKQPANGTTANYFIPNSNPFVGVTNALEEFFCLGLRSPHRMTLDPPTGRIFIGDVGAGLLEEVDIIEPGEAALNFQWSVIEGLQGDLTPPYLGINRRPVLDYDHGEGFAVIGGYVYRGSEFAADLAGKYIFGDNGSRTIWVLDESSTPNKKIAIATLPKGSGPNSGSDYTGLSSFGVDENNELFLCQMSSVGGRIYKLARTAPSPLKPLPVLLSQTGAFTNLTTLTAATGFIPYTVNSPLWSDAAFKSRWIALPTNTAITYAPTGEWSFPRGTVFMKHFDLATNDTNPALRKRLETRLLVCDTNGTFYGASYKWRADNSDADLVTLTTNEDITITTASGTRTQTWSYPGRQDCLRCHTLAAGGVLGAKARQLNGNLTYTNTGVTDNQLRAWNYIGMFTAAQNEAALTNVTRLVSVGDSAATLETRVRSYLDANCAHCHRPGGVPANFDARFDTPLAGQAITNGAVINSLNIAGAKVVLAGSTGQSILYQRVGALGPIQMPPFAKNVVDTNALTVIAAWINSLTNSAVTNTVPPPWDHRDIGSVALAGNAVTNGSQFNVTASGDDIWNAADAFHYVYQPLSGDGQITARVLALQNTDPWAKAGVMFRENFAPGSRHAFAAVTAASGTALQRRTAPDAGSAHTSGPYAAAPYWVRIVRAGNLFTAYASNNGTNWTLVDSDTIVMPAQIYVGLAATAHNNSALTTANFDNVLVASSTVAPFNLSPPPRVTNQVFSLSFGAVTGQPYTIEATTNFITWLPVFSNTAASNTFNFSTPTTNFPFRFYRARSP